MELVPRQQRSIYILAKRENSMLTVQHTGDGQILSAKLIVILDSGTVDTYQLADKKEVMSIIPLFNGFNATETSTTFFHKLVV